MPARVRTFKNANTPHSTIKTKGKIEKIDFKDKDEDIQRELDKGILLTFSNF